MEFFCKCVILYGIDSCEYVENPEISFPDFFTERGRLHEKKSDIRGGIKLFAADDEL